MAAVPEWKATADEIWAILKGSVQRQEEIESILKETESILKETDLQMKENAERQKETDRQMKENAERQKETDLQMKETDRQMKARQKEIDRQIEKVTKAIGDVHNSVGELVETLIAARIWEKFEKYHMERAYRRVPIFDENNRCVGEIDALMSNTTHAIAAEVKRLLKMGDVNHHLKRLELIRKYPPAEVKLNGKTLMGAVAGGTVPPEVRDYAHEKGLFVLELTGETARIVPPPDGFEPQEWK